ncbi:DNA helicase recq [Penicillium sp. IBT 18751x]|nr:DNA helicase recq [Penicillium sp. IBT 18751x]
MNDPVSGKGSEEDASTFRLNTLQHACLDFCIALLDQPYQTSAFDCALVCGLAALGYDHRGWLPFNAYVDILSKAIRIGQSFVVHYALLKGSDSEDYFDYMEGKDAKEWQGEEACHILNKKGLEFSEWLSALRNSRMVFGTKNPMGWMMSIAFEIWARAIYIMRNQRRDGWGEAHEVEMDEVFSEAGINDTDRGAITPARKGKDQQLATDATQFVFSKPSSTAKSRVTEGWEGDRSDEQGEAQDGTGDRPSPLDDALKLAKKSSEKAKASRRHIVTQGKYERHTESAGNKPASAANNDEGDRIRSVLKAFKMLQEEFNDKFKVMWA